MPHHRNVKTTSGRRKGRHILITLSSILLAVILIRTVIRYNTSVSCTMRDAEITSAYSEIDKIFTSVSLSCLVYGCEGCETVSGTVDTILDTQKMGIILENADISRSDPEDPATAYIDSGTFIRQRTGSFRFLTDLKDEKSSFYGAAFADDANRVVWIAYAGSVTLTDALQSSLLVLGAGLSAQEECAYALYEKVMKTEEIGKDYDLILTGHSLGGALATMVSLMSGTEAVTISGADGLAAAKINRLFGRRISENHITNYLTSAEGSSRSLKDLTQRLMFLGDYEGITCHVYVRSSLVENTHCIFGFVEYQNGEPVLTKEI